MVVPAPNDIAAQFALIRAQFIAGLSAREQAMLTAIDGADAVALAAALHRLVGAAGGYGCAALSDLARHAEQAVVSIAVGDWAALVAPVVAEMRRLQDE